MKKILIYALIASALQATSLIMPATAAEHPENSSEHPGDEVTAKSVKKGISDHVMMQTKASGGVLVVHDDKLNKDWKLKFVKVHDPVRTFMREGKAIFFACTDFKSVESDDLLDIDFWMVHKGKMFEVIDTKIHKVNGEPRYTYEGTEIKEIR